MYFENEYKTPKDRISDSFRDKLFEENNDASEVLSYITQNRYEEKPGCKCNDTARSNNGANHSRPLAMVYSPRHSFDSLYCDDEALQKGSLFSDLYFPFEAYCCGGFKPYGNGGCLR